jgi:hypothetical protein
LAIKVNTVPAQPGTISGNATICSGTSNSYSIVDVSGAISYTWTLPDGWTGSSTTNSISVAANTISGDISVTADNSCGSSVSKTLSVIINNTSPAQPDAINGNTTVCSGTSNTYSITDVSGAASYTWALPGDWTGSSATNSITAVAGSSGGDITVTAENGCGSSAARALTISVHTVTARPGIIIGNTTLCSGTSNTYHITDVPGATSYTWTIPGGWTGSSTTNSITVIAITSNGDITVFADNDCGLSAGQSLSVILTSIDTSVSLSGTTLTSNAAGAAYQWIDCGNGNLPISGETDKSFTAVASGNYAVIVSKNSCMDTSSCYSINTVGIIDNISSAAFKIYPNPSHGKFIIEMGDIKGRTENAEIEIYNLFGKKVFQSAMTKIKSEIDLSHQSNGIYVLKIHDGIKIFNRMIIVQEQ